MKKYQPQEIEQKWYRIWEGSGYFAPSGHGTPFSIAIPPPNVTGTLHMGHAFQHSLVDSLIRWRRMKGHDTLWQMGTDHAGISTQIIVSEQLEREQIKPSELGREKIQELKAEMGVADREDLLSFADLIDYDEGRID